MSTHEQAIDTEATALMGDRELEALRRHGFGVAYRMLGSVSEPEDVAQEGLLRLTRQQGRRPTRPYAPSWRIRCRWLCWCFWSG